MSLSEAQIAFLLANVILSMSRDVQRRRTELQKIEFHFPSDVIFEWFLRLTFRNRTNETFTSFMNTATAQEDLKLTYHQQKTKSLVDDRWAAG